jgi:IS5 family transposase
VVKNLFKHKKARYRGLAKNGAQYATLFALGNVVIAKKALLRSMEKSVYEAA